MILSFLRNWRPFSIDALGLVTLLGADQTDLAIGRLSHSPWTEGLPTLGAYKVAGDNITKPIPGFCVYNVTEGIMATDIPGWFSRWLLSRDPTWNATSFTLTYRRRPNSLANSVVKHSLSALTLGPLLALAVLIGDWWGCANVTAMIISVVVREFIVHQNRTALSLAADNLRATSQEITSFWTLPTGHAVTIRCPKGLLLGCLLTTPTPPTPSLYTWTRHLGWLGFGTHVITLGMTCLLNQLLSVALLIASTLLVTNGVGEDTSFIGDNVHVARVDDRSADFRAAAYARLELTPLEESYMKNWHLFPQDGNTEWWTKYRACQRDRVNGFKAWDKVLAKGVSVSVSGGSVS